MPKLDLDFETYSPLDITQVGAHKYALHPETEVLMAAWGVDHGPVNLWVPAEGQPLPAELEAVLCDPNVEVHAFNAQFERLILWHVLGYRIPIEQFRCTMTHAWTLSFSGGLASVGEQMGLGQDQRKLTTGKQLINRFCKPAPSNHKADRYTRHTHPDEWARFKEYCIQDVVAEREIALLLAGYPIHPEELKLWFWDQEVNDRGVPIDMDLVNAAVYLEAKEKSGLKHEMNQLTLLENANSNPQLQQWLSARGVRLPNMQAETIARARKEVQDPLVLQVLDMKAGVSKVSTTKWKAFQRATCDDGYLRGMFQFGGAQRTQRWAGRIVQLHNLKRPGKDLEGTIDQVIDVLLTRDLDLVHALVDDVLGLLSEGVRCAITAPEGYMLAPCDLGSIESRVLGYVSGCERINRIFREGKDTYKDFAMELFNVPYEQVTKAQRGYSKPPTLGCFAAETQVLTRRGWVPIVNILDQDELWDGEEWVQHDGLVFQGVKPVVPRHGVRATPDHRILSGNEWVAWSDLHGSALARALWSGSGSCSSLTEAIGLPGAPAGQRPGSLPAMLTEAVRYRVYPAQIGDLLGAGLPRLGWEFRRVTTTAWPTGATPRGVDAQTQRTPGSVTTAPGALSTGSQTQRRPWLTSSRCLGGTIRVLRSIASIIKGTTSPETCDSLTAEETRATPGSTGEWSTEGGAIPQRSSGESTHPATGIREPCAEKLRKEKQRNRSYESKTTVEVATFDILNAGPRTRFTVLTDKGPVLAHNCGYQLGGPGLVTYAEGMGVDMPLEDAKRAVSLYREIYPEVPQLWQWLIETCKEVTEQHVAREGYTVRIYRDPNFLFIELPSGRRLAYYQPLVLPMVPPWEKERVEREIEVMLQLYPEMTEEQARSEVGPPRKVPTLTYMGMNQYSKKWERLTTHGGKITENIIQAIARDVLAFHMRMTEDHLGPIIHGHVHDEEIPMVPEYIAPQRLQQMEEIMRIPPPWAPTLLLDAKGFLTFRYKKD